MKLVVNKNQLDMAPEQWLRRAGYGYIRDRRSGQDSFVRRLGRDFYPRLHMYAEKQGDKIIFNLHLDQKQASYAGAHKHNAEYEGEVVEAEINRLKQLIIKKKKFKINNKDEVDNPMEKIGSGAYDKDTKPESRKPWWRRIFS